MLEIALFTMTGVGTLVFSLIAYAYRNDMKYLKERITEIAIGTEKRFDEDHEDNKGRFDIVHKRIDDHEERIRANEATINKELK